MITKKEREALKSAGLIMREDHRVTTLTYAGYDVLLSHLEREKDGVWSYACITNWELEKNTKPGQLSDLIKEKAWMIEQTMRDLLHTKGYVL